MWKFAIVLEEESDWAWLELSGRRGRESGETYKEDDLDGVRASDGDEVGGVVFVAGADDENFCAMRVADVHGSAG